MHTLKTVLLGSFVYLLQPDISQYSMYAHSLRYIQMQLPEEQFVRYVLFVF